MAFVSRKRSRHDGNDDEDAGNGHYDKKPRQVITRPGDDERWYHGHHDSVFSTPISPRHQPRYDSDGGLSSMLSEPDSPRDASMSFGDEVAGVVCSPHAGEQRPLQSRVTCTPGRIRIHANRIATPMVPIRLGAPSAQSSLLRHHVRQRHPQEIFSSDHIGIPSPIEEDEVFTPPSATEAAGSQLSLLTVSDVDMDEDELVPTEISIDHGRPESRVSGFGAQHHPSSPPNNESMDSDTGDIVVRKQRQRSGALSSGISLAYADAKNVAFAKQRGFSVGFNPDCEKCRMRAPGHMNHFLGDMQCN